MSLHTLSVLVENKPGVLSRVTALFSRRAFNIHSLAVGPTEDESISRITLVVNAATFPLEQVVKQLNKLVNVIKIQELDDKLSVERKLMMVKVRANTENRRDVIDIVNLFRAHIIDVAAETVIVEIVGSQDKCNALLTALEPQGIKEIVQSGTVALPRGATQTKDNKESNRD